METAQEKPIANDSVKNRQKTRLVSMRLPEEFIQQATDWGFKNKCPSLAKSVVALSTPTLNNSTSAS